MSLHKSALFFGSTALIAAALAAAAPAARATLLCDNTTDTCKATISTGNFKTDVGVPNGTGGYLVSPLTLDFPLFNSSTATLSGVTITISGQINILNGTLTNNSTSAQSFTAKEDVAYSLVDSTNANINSDLSGVTLPDPKLTETYSNLGAGKTAPFAPTPNPETTSTTLSNLIGNLSSLTDFQAVGGGNDLWQLTTSTSQGTSGGGGNVGFNVSTDGNLTVQVTYNYTGNVAPAPEPASLLLVGSGLLALSVARRHKPRRQE